MTGSRFEVGGAGGIGGPSQLVVAVVAAALVLLIGLLVALAIRPTEVSAHGQRLPAATSTPTGGLETAYPPA